MSVASSSVVPSVESGRVIRHLTSSEIRTLTRSELVEHLSDIRRVIESTLGESEIEGGYLNSLWSEYNFTLRVLVETE